MILTVHTLAGIASSGVIGRRGRMLGVQPFRDNIEQNLKIYIGAFGTNLLLHQALDSMPHTHFLPSWIDITLSLLIPIAIFPFLTQRLKILSLFCAFGAIFPDILDFGILRILTGGSFYVFPTHWPSVWTELEKSCQNSELTAWYNLIIIFICIVIIASIIINRNKSRRDI